MTTCKTVQPRLTAYLDGELSDERGSVVRGHLRECAACRGVARDEAALRDGLHTLPPVDPPASLWAGVQARLAAAEVADARTPRWRRTFARWMPTLPRFAATGLVAAAAVAVLYWRAHQPAASDSPAERVAVAPVTPVAPVAPAQVESPPQQVSVPAAGDVTAELLAEPAQTTASYGQVIEELMKLATEARSTWTDEQSTAFDVKVAALHDGIQGAAQGRPQQHAQRALIRYLQRAVTRDDMLLASGGAR